MQLLTRLLDRICADTRRPHLPRALQQAAVLPMLALEDFSYVPVALQTVVALPASLGNQPR
jgi:hypothetical protein